MSTMPTIVAVASGWGGWGASAHTRWGLVRASGGSVGQIIACLLDPPVFPVGSIVPAGFRLSSSGLLPCWTMRGRAPRTYTGEDALELLVPGNPLVMERVLATLCTVADVREATPGEFSARAYLNGKLTIEQAEGVAASIAAHTDHQLAAAHQLLSGKAGDRYRAWADELATLLALVEAGIDFTDQEDVVPIPPDRLAAQLDELTLAVESELGGRQGLERASATPRVVLAGRPNAGKSTLFNALLGRKRAVESPVAGTTRDVIEEPLDLSTDVGGGGVGVTLVDVAGLDVAGPSIGEVDAQAQTHAAAAVRAADVVIHCDPSGRFDQDLGHGSVIRVRTKADLPAGPVSHEAISVCAIDGWHLAVLKRAIADAISTAQPGQSTGAAAVWPRHRRALAMTATRLHAAATAINADAHALAHPEMVADELRGALDALGEITGAISPDEVIGRVFATFCVGK